jgi:hypothetical protein
MSRGRQNGSGICEKKSPQGKTNVHIERKKDTRSMTAPNLKRDRKREEKAHLHRWYNSSVIPMIKEETQGLLLILQDQL